MRDVTRDMVRKYQITKLGYDFMGYTFSKPKELSFHHLIVAKKDCQKLGLGVGYMEWNGAILKQATSHDYLHLIQRLDDELFWLITNEMVEENIKGRIDIYNLKKIREFLMFFEKEHKDKIGNKGKRLIKREYMSDRIKLY